MTIEYGQAFVDVVEANDLELFRARRAAERRRLLTAIGRDLDVSEELLPSPDKENEDGLPLGGYL